MFIFRRSLATRLESAKANLVTLRADAIADADALDEAISRLARQASIADDVTFAVDDMLQDDEPADPFTLPELTSSEDL